MGSSQRSGVLHSGRPQVGPGVVWRAEDGWRFVCPARCGYESEGSFESARAAAAAFRTHWAAARDAEITALAQRGTAVRQRP